MSTKKKNSNKTNNSNKNNKENKLNSTNNTSKKNNKTTQSITTQKEKKQESKDIKVKPEISKKVIEKKDVKVDKNIKTNKQLESKKETNEEKVVFKQNSQKKKEKSNTQSTSNLKQNLNKDVKKVENNNEKINVKKESGKNNTKNSQNGASKNTKLDSKEKANTENITSKNSSKEKNIKNNELKKKSQKVTTNTKEIKNDKESNAEVKKSDSKVNNINTAEFFEQKKNKKRKLFFILILIISILVILLIFSTIFAIIHTLKPTIARGVSVKNIDISNLTYEEAEVKLEEAFDVTLNTNIEMKLNDYSYVMKSEEITLSYNFKDSLEQAYNIGRTGNIIKSNYSLIGTALLNKNINFEFDYNEEELDKVVEYIATSVPGLMSQYSYYIEENELIINPGKDGIVVNKTELKNQIIAEIANRNPLEIIKNHKNNIIQIPYDNVKADSIDIDKIYSEVKKNPQNAYYTPQTETTQFEIHPDVDGIDFAISIDEAKEIVKQDGITEYIIPLNRLPAGIKLKDIGIEAFPYIVSEFSTAYDASNISRSENLRIAASKINGTILMPGDQFSFNGVVGERTVAEGYKNAKIYSAGQVVDGLAGGICQISSTLYNAALLGNLQIDERYNHSFTTSYVKPGRDATVVYGIKDFKFTNNRKYPIKIEASVSNGIAEFKIYGIQEENEYDVKILPVTTSTTPYTVQTIEDPTLPAGSVVVSQAGASGSKVTTYKEVSLNGTVISKEVISNDVYMVMTRILRVGPTVVPTTPATTEPTTPTLETTQPAQ